MTIQRDIILSRLLELGVVLNFLDYEGGKYLIPEDYPEYSKRIIEEMTHLKKQLDSEPL